MRKKTQAPHKFSLETQVVTRDQLDLHHPRFRSPLSNLERHRVDAKRVRTLLSIRSWNGRDIMSVQR